MPLYEYECATCGHRFELLQAFDSPPSSCPKCGDKVERLLSSPAIQFKGSGWYVTDYARKSAPPDGGEASKKDSESSPHQSKSETSRPDKGGPSTSDQSTSKD